MIQAAFQKCGSLLSQEAAHPFRAELKESSPQICAADRLTIFLVKDHVS